MWQGPKSICMGNPPSEYPGIRKTFVIRGLEKKNRFFLTRRRASLVVMIDLPDDIVEQLLAEEPPEGAVSAHADRPLDYHWSVSADAAARTGWKASGDRLYDGSMRAIMAAAVLAGRAGDWVSYSRRKSWYKAKARYQGLAYSYARIIGCVDELLSLGLIEEERARPGDHIRTGRQSRFRATQKLLDSFAGERFQYDSHEVIRLRDSRGDLVDYRETAQTYRMRRELEAMNASHATVRLELPGEGVVIEGNLIRVDGATVRMTDAPVFHRSWSRGDFACGGRIYWWGQNLPSKRRKDLLIDGESVVELDYRSLHPRMLYARRGIVLDFDPYQVDGYERDVSKTALLVALNAPHIGKAVAALMHSTRKDGTPWAMSWAETRVLVNAVIARNSAIAADIASDVGIRLQHDDAEIAMRVVKACQKMGIVCLPVHDSFIVQARHADQLRVIMDGEIERYEGRFRRPEMTSDSITINLLKDKRIRSDDPQMERAGGGGDCGGEGSFEPILVDQDDRETPAMPNRAKKARIDLFDFSTRPTYDRVESARRWEAAGGDVVKYVAVPGELEHLLWPMHGLRTGEVIDQLRREHDWHQAFRACPVPPVIVDPWYKAERRRREAALRLSRRVGTQTFDAHSPVRPQ